MRTIIIILILAHLSGPGLAEAPPVPWEGIAMVAPEPIKRAMQKMGPGYDYKIKEGMLYVSMDRGKTWLRLKYCREARDEPDTE